MFDNFIFPILCRMAGPTLHISFVMLLSKLLKLFHGMSEMQAKSGSIYINATSIHKAD